MSWHATCNWMDRKANASAALLDQLCKFAHRMLRLRNRHAVARHNDHISRIPDAHRRVFRRHAAGGQTFRTLMRCGGLLATKRAEEHVGERAVHRLRHEDREDEAACAVECAGDDQDVVADRKPCCACSEACVRVEE